MDSLQDFPLPLLGFAAYSGTGKTTLLEQLITILSEQGFKVGLIKHSHHDIELDKPGKDSFRLRQAGASQVILAGKQRSICFHEQQQPSDRSLIKQLSLLDTAELDLVLVEGYRDQAFAKIELHRAILNKPYIYTDDQHVIALVSDTHVESCALPQFQFTQVTELIAFIKQSVINK
nr:hypothetical protein BCCFPMHH_00034 [uncultured bacterium]